IWLAIGKRNANTQDESTNGGGDQGNSDAGGNSSRASTDYGKVNSENCGLHAIEKSNYINSFRPKGAEINAYPWIVKINFGGKFKCVGVLVTNQWILTSNTCVINTDLGQYKAIIGETGTPLTTIKHSNQPADDEKNHLVLVKIKDKIADTDFRKPICLDQSITRSCQINYFYRFASWKFNANDQSNKQFFETDLQTRSDEHGTCYRDQAYKFNSTCTVSDHIATRHVAYLGAPLMNCEPKENGRCFLIGSLIKYQSFPQQIIACFANVRGNLKWIIETVDSEE
ncbi:MAG: Enteropeptidase, partial [Marteilia pararefringens]